MTEMLRSKHPVMLTCMALTGADSAHCNTQLLSLHLPTC